MKYSVPTFNQAQLSRQRKQYINNAYNQIAYIQKDCKPFLYRLKTENIEPFFIDKLMKFVCNAELQTVPFLGYDYYIPIRYIPSGKYALFPTGKYLVYDKETKLELVGNSYPTSERDLIIICNRYYIIETSLYNSIKPILKNLPLIVQP